MDASVVKIECIVFKQSTFKDRQLKVASVDRADFTNCGQLEIAGNQVTCLVIHRIPEGWTHNYFYSEAIWL